MIIHSPIKAATKHSTVILANANACGFWMDASAAEAEALGGGPSKAFLARSSKAGIVSPTKRVVNATRRRQNQLASKLVDVMMSFW